MMLVVALIEGSRGVYYFPKTFKSLHSARLMMENRYDRVTLWSVRNRLLATWDPTRKEWKVYV